ncbi:MAG: hypothetical protein KKB34_05140 [Bacteroidetes bacterium]|nr:hypothetical protein [Bacteroidota bacterium]
MPNRIKDLNPGGALLATDLFGIDRMTPDESFKVSMDSLSEYCLSGVSSTPYAKDTSRLLAHLLAVADIDNKAIQNSGKFYDLFDSTNGYSQGILDSTKTELAIIANSGESFLKVDSLTTFEVGQEITVQSSISKERHIITSLDIDSLPPKFPTTDDSKSLTTTAQENAPQGVAFSSDGSKLYIGGLTYNAGVFQYTLSTPWDVSTASYASKNFQTSGQTPYVRKLRFSSSGDKMFILDNVGTVYQYTLSTPWDISTSVYNSISFSPNAQENGARGLDFKPDGSKMYIVGTTYNTIFQYNLSTPWNVGTASYSGTSFNLAGVLTSIYSLSFSDTGYLAYIGNLGAYVYELSLSTPWDISTITTSSNKAINTVGDITVHLSKIYFLINNGYVRQHSLTESFVNVISLLNPLASTFSINTPVYRSLGTINVSDQYSMDDSYDYTNIDIRYNIDSITSINELVAWITYSKITGASISCSLSMVDSSSNETYIDLEVDQLLEISTNIMEARFSHAQEVEADKTTLRITMTRALNSDSLTINKLLGAIG